MNIHRPLLTLALLACCSGAFAQWQWLDAEGRKVFSDRPPPADVPEKSILKRPGSVTRAAPVAAEPSAAPLVPASGPAGGLDKELQAKKKAAADAEAAKRKEEEDRVTKSKIENCARAKQAKVTLDSGIRIARTNANGEREVLDDAARASENARIQGIIATECR